MGLGWKIFIGAISTAIGTAAIWGTVTAKNLMRICYEVAGFKIRGLDSRYIYLDIQLRIKNPANLRITIRGYYIDIYINDIWVANSQSKIDKVIKGEQTSILNLSLDVDYKKTLSRKTLSLFLKSDLKNIFVRIKGKFIGAILGVKIDIDIDEKISLLDIQKTMKKKPKPC